MGTRDRTRPDESRKPSYVTAEGYRALEKEAHRLWTVERPKLAKAVAVTAAEGDRSENAEYIYGKKKLAEIDRRLAFLSARLDVLTIVADPPASDGKVRFGSYVTLEGEQAERVAYRIVGPDETNAEKNEISIESPMAKALLGREEGDEVTVRRPRGAATFVVELCRERAAELDRQTPVSAAGRGQARGRVRPGGSPQANRCRAIVRICISVVPPPRSRSFASRARRSTTYSSM